MALNLNQLIISNLCFLIILCHPSWAIVPARPGAIDPETGRFFSTGESPLKPHRHPSDLPKQAPYRSKFVPTQGNIKILVILADFPYKTHHEESTKEAFEELFFSVGTYPTGSMNDYYLENSYGNFSISGDVIDWMEATRKIIHYANRSYGYSTGRPNAMSLVEDMVKSADELYEDLDFSDYDNDGDGVVDTVFIVHAGQGAEETGDRNDLWSLYWQMDKPFEVDGVLVRDFQIVPERTCADFREVCYEMGISAIGVIAHEFGHFLGLPDLYDTTGQSEGIGVFGLMATGLWGGDGNSPNRPVHFCAWSKRELGWLSDDIVLCEGDQELDVSLNPVETGPEVVEIYPNGCDDNQYFLVENRQNIGFDEKLPGHGLLIWQVDECIIEENFEDNTVNDDKEHKGVDLEEGDRNNDLDKMTNQGDYGDFYPGRAGRKEFSRNVTPSSAPYTDMECHPGDRGFNTVICNIQEEDRIVNASYAVLLDGEVSPCKPPPPSPSTSTPSSTNDVGSCACQVFGRAGDNIHFPVFIVLVLIFLYFFSHGLHGLNKN